MAYKTLVAASTKPLVLSILSHGKSYGYQIIKNVEQLSNGELEWTDAMLYPVLHRMEKDGLIASEWIVLDNGRKRKYYTITAKGKEERDTSKAQWNNVNTAFNRLWGANLTLDLG
ncbi:PadR family transcriptional regulator [Roseivirga sp. E12]|uniref:PadR family transcriptional regulator n=1 Tax=Roseivirga sp. E12 TaxID=2819237 RepID=UPI001ABC2169|nr:PadR family transcriptional regulator [Roseivirga sp. E12]MBO3698240.1 PadR family transcriptional regulator [Roseivirga sp. E12]